MARRWVVVGHGMVAHHFVQAVIDGHHLRDTHLTVVGEERRPAYDRVHLSRYLDEPDAQALQLAEPDAYADAGVTLLLGEPALVLDRGARTITTSTGRTLAYDRLILATGSRPFVPPLPGRDLEGTFVYRTLEDLDAIRARAVAGKTAIVIGGGLLGLEAAGGLARLGVRTIVVELAPRLMPLQLDAQGSAVLRAQIEAMGVEVHLGVRTDEIVGADGRVVGLRLDGGKVLDADLVVFSAGVRPRDELGKAAGLTLGARGGIVIDEGCVTSDPGVLAIGECAAYDGRTYGLVAPGYQMADVALATLTGGAARFSVPDLSTRLKLLGVEVGSLGDALGETPGCHTLSVLDLGAGRYHKLVLSPDRKQLLGAILVGDTEAYPTLLSACKGQAALPEAPLSLIAPAPAESAGSGGSRRGGVLRWAADAMVCSCLNVTKGTLCNALAACPPEAADVATLKRTTKAGSGCGSCVPLLNSLVADAQARAGVAVSHHLCEHFPYSRQELHHLVRLHRIESFAALIARHGTGQGCEVCKPAVASILASAWNGHVLDRAHLSLQDSNDRFLANLQRDGTYSVVPRVPGGEITPEQLITLGQVAKQHGLYAKITGGQRVDLLGARVEQLPDIWRELVAAGFESGHAYGKALRTVKSCVGSTWCRYGVQDSLGLAIRLENRYKGLRSPHKLKSAVSGCARECAEAQSKDFGIIATERGYNLYVGGNGGMKPRHAELLATDLDEETLVRYVDRFLMFYVRTADRLQRTAAWIEELEGGIDYLRRVVIEDALGLGAELEAEMAHVVGTYRCEWAATLEDPDKLARFRPFVNSDAPDPSIVRIRERGQPRPPAPTPSPTHTVDEETSRAS